ncbi:hypothetical protein [Paenibacillus prosopidis]|uniref:DnaD/phage-associated family protein n=1 Tax=Paenibacillus prosopidis TaxID=630520 RepID=A0A368VRG8_9BACL|nr:hypothetical protein [Paenibacillus prosopidis]RCW44243.1 hypothetical protein DFP97_112107 [Paenibacillus prosopidis]
MSGYISLHRDIQKHWLYEEERVFSKYEAWLDILMRVNHTEGKVTHNGTLEIVQRGSTIWSMGDMEKHWGWSNRKVKRFLDCLVADQMLTYKSTTKKTYLTVINYDIYQDTGKPKAPPMHQQSTAEAFQKHTNNNVNNLNNYSSEVVVEKNDPKTAMDAYIFSFKKLQYNGHIQNYVMNLLGRGYKDPFIREVFMQMGANGVTNPNVEYMRKIAEDWITKGISNREEAAKHKEAQREGVNSGRATESIRQGPHVGNAKPSEGQSGVLPSKWVKFDKDGNLLPVSGMQG